MEGNTGVIFEVNSETDFVAKNEQFLELLETVKDALIANKPADLDAALACTVNGETIGDLVTTDSHDRRKNLSASYGCS